jgi:hypothetical protein
VIVGMLRELGIPSTIVIVRSGLRGEFDSSVASLAPFDHAIAYVPSLNLYLDGTAEYAGSTELPIMDLGSVALLVNEGASKLVRLPQAPPEENVRRRRIAATLGPDGSAALEVEHEVIGVHAPSWRRHYHAAGTQTERVTEELGGEFPGFDLRAGGAGISAENLGDFEQPVRLTARGTASRFARREGTHLSTPVTPPIRLTPSYASLSKRKTDVKLPPIGTIEDTFVVKLPHRSRVVSAPEPKRAESPFGSYSVEVEVEPAQVTVKSRIVVRASVITPKQYAAWQQFCADVDQALTPRLVVASQ